MWGLHLKLIWVMGVKTSSLKPHILKHHIPEYPTLGSSKLPGLVLGVVVWNREEQGETRGRLDKAAPERTTKVLPKCVLFLPSISGTL